MKMIEIAILCTLHPSKSNYRLIPCLTLYDKEKDCRSFTGSAPVITHAPCAQWSRLRAFANLDEDEKLLAFFCWQKVNENGGIFEHPCGSSFFKEVGADFSKIITVDQCRWSHPLRKRTWLYFHNYSPLALPVGNKPKTNIMGKLPKFKREATPLAFAKWLVNCIRWQSR